VYAYGLCIAGVLVVVDLYRRTGNRYRLQTFVILLGTLFPFLGGIVTVVDVGSYAHLAWFPAGLVVHGVFLYGTVFWLGTLDAAVVARDTAVEVMQDPVIVAGSDGRIRDLNPAAEELLPSDAVGSSLSNVFPLLEVGVEHPISIGGRQFDIQEDPITDPRGTDRGHVFLLRDVTERERRQTELERREVELERQNESGWRISPASSPTTSGIRSRRRLRQWSSLATATGTTRTHSTAPRTPTSGWTT